MGILILDVEILRLALSVVGGNEVLDDIGQVVFLCQLDAFGDMADNHLSTVDGAHFLMGINA